MRLCRFDPGAGARHGIVEDGFVADRDDPSARHALEDVRLLAPVLPRKFLGIGLNYADHIAESGMEAPQFPVFFNKQVTCVVGPGDDLHMPRVSNLLDIAECMLQSGLQREESRGAHQRTDFPRRDDDGFLAHQLVTRDRDGGPRGQPHGHAARRRERPV